MALEMFQPPPIDISLAGNTAGVLTLVNSGTLTLAGGPNITVSQAGNAISISAAAGGGATFSAGISGGNTSGNTGTVSNQIVFAGGNNITLSGSTNAGGMTVTVSAFTQTVQTQNLTTFTAGISGGNTAGNTGTVTNEIVFAGGNNITLSGSTNAAGMTVTVSAFNQSAESNTFGMSNLDNTAGTSGVVSANQVRYLIVGDLGIIASQSLNGASGTLSIVNSWSTGTTASSVATANAVGGNAGRFAMEGHQHGGVPIVSVVGNTAGNTTQGNMSLVLAGGPNVTLSGSTNAGVMTVSISGPNASTLISTLSYWEPWVRGQTTTSQNAQGTVYFQPFIVDAPLSIYRMHLLQQMTTQNTTTFSVSGSISGGNATSATGSWGQTGTVLFFTRQSTGTAANSSRLVSYVSNSYSLGIQVSESVSWSTNASSATVSYTTSQAMTFFSSFNSTGGVTTGSFGTSGSASFSSTSTNAHTFSSSNSGTFASGVISQVRPLIIPMATSFSPGEYWMAHIQSTNSGSTTEPSLAQLVNVSLGIVAYSTNMTGYAEMGSTATIASSNVIPGWGSYSSSGNTSTTIPISQISGMSQLQTWFNMMAQVK